MKICDGVQCGNRVHSQSPWIWFDDFVCPRHLHCLLLKMETAKLKDPPNSWLLSGKWFHLCLRRLEMDGLLTVLLRKRTVWNLYTSSQPHVWDTGPLPTVAFHFEGDSVMGRKDRNEKCATRKESFALILLTPRLKLGRRRFAASPASPCSLWIDI